MKLIKSELVLEDFFIVKSTYNFNEPQNDNINVKALIPDYEIDIDFIVRDIKNEANKYMIFAKVSINNNDKALSGYSLFAEGVSIYSFDNTSSLSEKEKSDFNILEETAKLVMSLKNVSGTYSTNDGILLPGFGNKTDILGLDQNFRGQSWEFVTGGFQELDIFGRETAYNYAETAYTNGWLVDTMNFKLINTQYAVTHTEKLNLKATLKPIKGLRIDLTANYNIASNNTSNLGIENGAFAQQNQRFTGSFSRSIVAWNTAFIKDKGDNSDDLSNITFDNLREMRSEVSQLIGLACCKYRRVVDSIIYF